MAPSGFQGRCIQPLCHPSGGAGRSGADLRPQDQNARTLVDPEQSVRPSSKGRQMGGTDAPHEAMRVRTRSGRPEHRGRRGPGIHARSQRSSPASEVNPAATCEPDGSGRTSPTPRSSRGWRSTRPTPQLVGVYQQDRYSNGGSKGMTAAVSFNGGVTWATTLPSRTTPAARAASSSASSDPWVSFGPDGVLHAMSLVTDPDVGAAFGANGMTYNRSTNGGVTWEPAVRLITDPVGRFLNDKNSITADPNDAGFVYAVWDRLQVSDGFDRQPGERRRARLQGADLLHPDDQRRRQLGAGPQDLRDRSQQADDRQPDRRASAGRAVRLLRRHHQQLEPARGIGPVKLSYIRSDDHGQNVDQADAASTTRSP